MSPYKLIKNYSGNGASPLLDTIQAAVAQDRVDMVEYFTIDVINSLMSYQRI